MFLYLYNRLKYVFESLSVKLLLGLMLLFWGNLKSAFYDAKVVIEKEEYFNEKRDSLNPKPQLSILEVINQIELSHPLVSAYRNESKLGKANLLASRGAFDPSFNIQTNEKTAGRQPYYQNESFELKIPTASPFQFETGVESGRGNYVNPEFFTPSGGLSFAGVSLPLLKGLITDTRRNTLAKAKIFRNQSIENQKIELLELSQIIWKDYIEWYVASEQLLAYQNAVELSLTRQVALRSLFEAGGCNGMDTLENFIQLQLFQTMSKEWTVNTFKQRMQLSRHLWSFDSNKNEWLSVLISDEVIPSKVGIEWLDSQFKENLNLQIDLFTLPDIRTLEWDIEQKRLDVKLKRWDLLPKVDLKYQQLFSGVYQEYSLGNDRRFGLSISAPLFLRKERGEYLWAKLQWEQKNQMFQFKINETHLKIKTLRQQVNTYQDVYAQLKQIENGFLELYQLELEKFNSGDGTIFLLNTRENRYISSKIKTIEQFGKYQNTLIDYLRETGKISQSIFGVDGL